VICTLPLAQRTSPSPPPPPCSAGRLRRERGQGVGTSLARRSWPAAVRESHRNASPSRREPFLRDLPSGCSFEATGAGKGEMDGGGGLEAHARPSAAPPEGPRWAHGPPTARPPKGPPLDHGPPTARPPLETRARGPRRWLRRRSGSNPRVAAAASCVKLHVPAPHRRRWVRPAAKRLPRCVALSAALCPRGPRWALVLRRHDPLGGPRWTRALRRHDPDGGARPRRGTLGTEGKADRVPLPSYLRAPGTLGPPLSA